MTPAANGSTIEKLKLKVLEPVLTVLLVLWPDLMLIGLLFILVRF